MAEVSESRGVVGDKVWVMRDCHTRLYKYLAYFDW